MERKLLRKEGFNAKKIWRAALFASTGLSAVVSLPAMVRAQTTIPSDTTPQGGVVVGGSASITQAPASTTVNQSSERTAINWQSFDVGSGAKVQFNQPDASAIALNRVVGGNLSQINGQIDANGQIVLINQSGVVFGKGAQVNAENIVVSTSDIATKDFMAGNMAFTGAPNPGAKILNEGKITVKDTGLVGLIAPQVENNGVIVARLGQVVLAGASAFTLDLYGDRLISLDVTKAVQAVDVNGQKVAALVTNRGVILADGGKVTLTAQDADALVTQLINAGGTIRADIVGSQAGTISIQGVGGDISIAGNLLARGGKNSSGGAIEALTTGTVSVAPTADIDASGNAGGGVIAIGTDIARAQQGAADVTAPKAAFVTISQGSRLNAEATGLGNAGTVTLLSSQNTAFDGAISVQGGSLGGNGGAAEISSDGVISLGGTVLATAINGKAGEILLDPQTLVVSGAATTATISGSGGTTVVGGFDATVTSTVLNTDLDALSGTIILEAASLISVTSSVNSSSIQALSLVSHGSISVTASIDIDGLIDLDATGSLFVGAGLTGSSVLLISGAAGTDINAGVSAASGTVTLGSTGTIFEGSAGSIVAASLISAGSIGGGVTLANAGNTITTLGSFKTGAGLTLANSGGLTAGGSVSAANISLSGASLTFESGVSATGILALSSTGTISQGAGTIAAGTLTGNNSLSVSLTKANSIGTLGAFSVNSGTLALTDAGSLTVAGSVSAPNVTLTGSAIGFTGVVNAGTLLALASSGSITQTGGSITAGTLASLGTIGGNVSLASATNNIGTLGNFTLGGNLDLNGSTVLHIAGTVATPQSITLAATGGITEPGGIDAATLTSGGTINANVANVNLTGTNQIGTLGNFGVTGGSFGLADGESLVIAGTVDVPSSGFVYFGKGVTETGAGVIDARDFSTNLETIAGDILLAGNNTISFLQPRIYATGTIDLNDTSSLNVSGNVAAANVTIAAPTLAASASNVTIAATAPTPTLVLASNTITTTDATDKFLAGSGTIDIAPFSANTTIDIGSGSSAGTLGLPGSIISALDTTAAKIIIGKGPIGTQASGIDIDGAATFGSTPVVDLSTSGTIFDNSGNLTAGSLQFGAPGGFTQSSTAGITATQFGGDGATAASVFLVGENTISSFTSLPLSAASTLALFDTGTLTISGAIDPAAVTLFGTAGLDIGTNVSATLLEIGSGGSITQSGGSITATTLASFGSITGDASLTSTTNSIGTLSAFTLGGTLDLVDAGSLDVAGSVGGPVITLSAAGIGVTGIVNAGSLLALASTGAITQSGGSIVAPTLTSIGTIGGEVLLGSTTNSLAVLNNFNATGTLALADAAALSIEGSVAAPTVSLSADGITLAGGTITAPVELALGGAGGFSETSGQISTGSLVSIGTLGNDFLAGLTGTATIAAIGDFSLATGGGGIDFHLGNATSAQITGLISAPGGGVELLGSGATETGAGAILTGELTTSLTTLSGDLLLTGNNTIALIGIQVNASGTVAIADTGSLSVNSVIAGADVTLSAPTIALASGVTIAATAATPTLALASDDIAVAGGNSFLAGSGTIAIAPLTASTVIDFGSASSAGTLGLAASIISVLDTTASAIIIGKGPVGTQASAIDIDNSVSFGGTSIVDLSTSGTISDNTGTFSAATLEFDSAGFTQAGSAVISARTLAGDGTPVTGSVLLLGTANAIGTLNGFSLSSGTLALLDTGSLDAAGTITAPAVSLSSDTLGLNGSLDATTLLALGGMVTESGSITTPSLVSIGTLGEAVLTGSNSITSLGSFAVSGGLALEDEHALDIAGAVSAGGTVTLTGTSLTETTGRLTATNLTTGAGSFTGSVALTGTANNIESFGPFTLAAGTLALDDAAVLIITGAVSAPTVTLVGPSGMVIGADINAPTALALGGANTIVQTAGTITTGSLTSAGSIGGNVTLANANSIAGLGNFTLGNDLTLADAISLAVTGLVHATSAGSEIILDDGGTISAGGSLVASTVLLSAANSIGLSGLIDAATLLELGGGTITQTGGTIIAGALASDGTVSGGVTLARTANTIATLGSFFTGGSFDLVDTGTLNINGSVSGQNISLSVPTLGLAASVDSTLSGGTLALALDAFTIASGTLGANAGTVELAPFTNGHGIDLGGSAANALDLTGNIGTLFGGNPVAYVIGSALGSKASFIDVDGSVSFATGIVDLTTTGTIADNSGTLSTPTLEFDAASFTQATTAAIAATTLRGDGGTIAGSVLLAGTANAIGTLGGMSLAAGTLALTDAGSLNVTGSVTAPDIDLTDSNASGINIGGGSLVANGGGTVGFTTDALTGSTGTISAPGGLVRIAPNTASKNIDFGGTAAGDLNLASGFIDLIGSKILQIGTTGGGAITQANAISVSSSTLVLIGSSLDFTGSLGVPTLLSFATAGDVAETAGATISVPSITGTASGTIGLIGTNAIGTLDAVSAGSNITINNGPSLLIAGLVTTSLGNSITLDDNAGVTEVSGGTLSAGTLSTGTGSIGGAAVLANANAIGTISGFTATGDLTFRDAGALTLAGPVSAADGYVTASGIGITGSVNVGAGTLGLFSSNGITEAVPGGVLKAGTLTGTVSAGSATLLSGNSISNIGAFTVSSGNLTLNNAIGLNVSGLVHATDIELSGTSLTETTGTLTATALSTGAGDFTGNVSLTGANSINTLGGFTLSAGTLTLDDTGLLTVDGPVNAPITTLSAQTMAIAGTISASTGLALESTGAIFETLAGFIATPSLTSGGTTIAGNVSLASSNSIATLASFTTNSDLTLHDGGALTVAGPVSTSNATLSADGITFTGGIGATILSLASGGGISETSGIIHAATLTGTSATIVSLLNANTISTLGGFSVTSGNFGISNTSVLEIAGLVTVPGTIMLEGVGDTEISGGTLSAATLNAGGTTIAGNVFLGNANQIGTLGGFTLGGGDTLSLQDATLTLAGPVIAPIATLSAGSISISGAITSTTSLALESTGNITEASGGIIDTPSLTSGGTTITGNVSLTSAANTINTLGGFSLGTGSTLALNDTGLLTIAGPVATPFGTISANTLAVDGTFSGTTATFASGAGGMGVTGSISLATLVGFASTGNVTESGAGQITAGTLVSVGSSISGNVLLANTLNAIGTLGNFTIGSGDTLNLADAGLLTVDGPVNAPITTLSAQSIAIAGTISASTGLALESTGAIFETLAGFIATPSLTSGGTTIAGNVSLASSNSIATLASFTTNSDLTLHDGGALTVAGPVSTSNATLSADGITFTGGIGATILSLASGGGISETSGIIHAATLTGTSATIVSLLNANTISTLGGFSVTSGNFGISNTSVLEIAGLVTVPGTIMLEGVGDTEISGGTLSAATLNAGGTTIAGNVFLGNANQIGTLGGFTLGGGDTLSLQDATLTLAGPVIAPIATLSAGSISISGAITSTTSLALESTGNITEASGGIIDTPSLTSGGTTITGNVSLTSAANTINTLGGFSLGTGSTLALNDTGLLTIAGPVATPFGTISANTLAVDGTFSGTTATFASGAGGMGVTGSISLSTLLGLASTGNVIESGAGQISAATLVSTGGSISGNVSLANTLNAIGTLGNFTIGSGDTLDLADSGLLTVAGTVAAPFATLSSDTINVPGTLSGTWASLAAGIGGIGITGLINAGSLLALSSNGDITESGAGGIDTGTLISLGTISGNVLLTDTLDNAISTLGGFTIGSGDTLVLDDAGLLTVIGPVNAVNATFYAGTLAIAGSLTGASQTLTGGNIVIEAPISVTSELALETPGNVTETGAGTITAPLLDSGGTTIGSSLGNYVSLTTTANSIGTLGGFTVAGTLDLVDSGSLNVAGTVEGPFVSLTSGTINFSGVVDASSKLALGGSLVTENGGQIITPSLVSIGSIAGDVALTSANNTINTLGGFDSGGTINIADTGLLTVAGPVDGPVVSLSSDTIAFTGIVNASGLLALGSTGTITQTSGEIIASTLMSIGSVGGDVSLVSNINTIDVLGPFTLGGTLDLLDTGLLTVGGLVQGNVVSLSSDTLAFTGVVNAGSLIALGSTEGITQSGGSLQAPTLVSIGTIGGNVSLVSTNAIGTLGGFTVANSLTLDNETLAVAGPVIAPDITLSAAGISISGTISASSDLALESTAGITEVTAGVIITPSLTSGGTEITGGNVGLSGTLNSITTLGRFTAADDVLLDDNIFLNAGPITAADVFLGAPGINVGGITAFGTLGLFSTENITESGLITAATLTGTSADSVSLLTGNSITTLADFSVTSGGFSLNNAIGLDIAGLVTVGTLDTITLEDSAGITESTGTLIAGTLNSGGTTIGGDVALTDPLNNVLKLGGFTLAAGDTLTLDDTSLVVAGPIVAPFTTLSANTIVIAGSINAATALALESTGNITEPGGSITTTSLTSGGTTIGGNALLTGTNVINTLAAFSETGTLTLDDTGLLTVAGPVTLPVATLSAPTIAINGAINAATQLALESTGSITEGGAGAVSTGTLTSGGGAIGGNVTLNSALNTITTLGQFAAAGLALSDQTPLSITSPVAVTGVLALLDTGNVIQTGGTISAGTLTSDGGTLGGAGSFNQTGNNIPVLGAFGAVAGLALTDAVPLNLTGNIFTGSTAPLSLVDTGGAITQSGGAVTSGTLNVNGSNVTLGQANAIGTAGTITAANAYVNGIGGFSGPVNVGSGTFLTAGGLSVNSNLSAAGNLVLEALGGISQTAGSIAAGAATLIAGGDIVLSGVLAAAGDLDLVAGGNISHPAGLLTAGTLSGAVGGTVITDIGSVIGNGSLASFNFSSFSTDFATIGNFIMQDSTFALINDGPLELLGSLVANTVSITTNGGFTFEGTSNGSGGGLFINANPVSATPYFTPQPGDSVITVTNGGITQTDTFDINTANGPPANLFLYVFGGSVAFSTSGQLYGPTTNLEISDAGGAISGNVVLQRLVVLNALTQSVQLTGQLDGLGGQAAASKGFVDPFPEPEFRFNACPIGSVNCTILPIETLPPGNPLENFDLTQRKRRKLNNNVHLPGVATRDF